MHNITMTITFSKNHIIVITFVSADSHLGILMNKISILN